VSSDVQLGSIMEEDMINNYGSIIMAVFNFNINNVQRHDIRGQTYH
jgi:hypothetical protein